MKILVTGASGFIGGRFARFALEQGLQVRVNGRRREALAPLVELGAEFMPGDLADAALVRRLCQGMDAVVHCAGAVGVWGPRAHFEQANVGMTEQVVEACLKQSVPRLVHLSSPSIYFDGRAHVEISEDQLPRRFANHYGATKYQSERVALGASEFGLEVVALRPRFVTGAGDTSIFPRMIAAQRKGRLKIIGRGLNRVDFTSVQNLNQALFSALRVSGAALGQAYNISNGQPTPLWDVVNYVLRRLELPSVSAHMPYSLAYGLATLNEGFCLLRPGRPEPTLTRMGMAVLARDFSLDISRARQFLDYQPQVSLWEALDEFCDWWKVQDQPRSGPV
ncbi:MAG: 2-alkyl-3-oxoalkanoate reductase [Stenotrophomonas maltophilia]|nr:MAG: 2-alkyl-3-oxoalkanoate reductase [Stenotrophomonas maltophilia]